MNTEAPAGLKLRDKALSSLRAWRASPVAFVRQVLKAEPDAWQADVLAELGKPERHRIALKASKGPGKSTVLAWGIWWWMLTRPHPKIAACSITETNLQDNLWTELAKWQHRSKLLEEHFHWSKQRVFAKAHEETWWCSARTWPKDATQEQQADTLAGLHADFAMAVVDEAGGIPPGVVAAAEGALANADAEEGREAKLLIAGNPTDLNGALYVACRSPRWWTYSITGDPDHPKRAPRVSVEWARAQIDQYGRDSAFVRINVFGEFPLSQSNTLIGRDVAEEAGKRVLDPAASHSNAAEPRILGVDVARFGDDRTVLFPRQGRIAYRPQVFRELDTMQTAGQVAGWIARWKPAAVFVDATGLGAGVVDRLRELGHPVIGVESGAKAHGDRYWNMRVQMWASMAEWMKRGCTPSNLELLNELCSPRFSYASDGRMKLESKDEIKKRTGASPDLADALALTFAFPVARREDDAAPQQGRKDWDYDPLRAER